MGRGVLGLVLAAGAVLSGQTPPGQIAPKDRKFESSVELTSITASVFDSAGHLVKGLSREAFDVYEDGELQQVSQFTNERVPIGLGVLLDMSDSMFGERIQDARAVVNRFLFEDLDQSDEFFILAFNHKPHMITQWTKQPDVVKRALDSLIPNGGTALYDAVMEGLGMIERRSNQRASLVIISDGSDTASNATIRDVRSALLRSEAFTFAVAIDSPDRRAINSRVNPTTLREITDQSGGRTEVVHTTPELQAATDRIAEELNSQYLLGYSSTHAADGQFHSIRVRVRGSDYKVRARNGYVAGGRKK